MSSPSSVLEYSAICLLGNKQSCGYYGKQNAFSLGQAQYTNLTPSQPLYDGVTRQIFRKNVILTIITHTWLHERCIGRFKGTGFNCLPPKKRFLNTVKKLRETLERWTSLCSEIQVKPMSVHSLHLHLSHYTHPTLIQSMDP